MVSMAEKSQLGATLTGLGNAAPSLQLRNARRSGEARFGDDVSDFSRGASIEKGGQQARVDGDPA